MNLTSKTLALAAALVLATFAATGCTVEGEPDEESSSQSDELVRGSTGGGTSLGYTCTEAGACSCSGYGDCWIMFPVCKSNVYCNFDHNGYRCICWNFSLSSGARGSTSPETGDGLTVK